MQALVAFVQLWQAAAWPQADPQAESAAQALVAFVQPWQAVVWLQADPQAESAVQALVAFVLAWQGLVATWLLVGQVAPPPQQAFAVVHAVFVALGHGLSESLAQPISTAADIPTTSSALVISFFLICNSPSNNRGDTTSGDIPGGLQRKNTIARDSDLRIPPAASASIPQSQLKPWQLCGSAPTTEPARRRLDNTQANVDRLTV